MKQSQFYIPTLKEVPSIAEVKSHKLLLKAGYIYQTAAGIYTYLPMANKILDNIEKIVSEEIEKIGANKVRMPFLEPSDLWEQSGRWEAYGSELFRIQDRNDRFFALAPTHEEVATDLLKSYLNSYKKFPMNIFQIQTKLRDERRPRFGLLRGREFIMMDGYTFDVNDENLKINYEKYYNAYINIFNKLGIKFKIVQADNGTMGGKYSHEFMALSEIGEDFIAYDDEENIAYNQEIAPIMNKYIMDEEEILELEEIHTPDVKKVEDLNQKYEFAINKLLKAVCYDVDGELVICFVLGNREVEETKVLNLLKGNEITIASNELLNKNDITPGFIGPIGLNDNIKVYFDNEIQYKKNLISGANRKDYHTKNINLENVTYYDLRKIEEGDLIVENGNPIKIVKGIEIGHVFALGKKYTEALKVSFLDENQKLQTPTMGSYGIGISRLLGTIVEQNNDENGIILPEIISPFLVHVIPLDYHKNPEQKAFTDEIIKLLEDNNITYLLDDRSERAGIKFKDADLIGLPKQIIIGKKFSENIVEFKERKNSIKKELQKEEIISELKKER